MAQLSHLEKTLIIVFTTVGGVLLVFLALVAILFIVR